MILSKLKETSAGIDCKFPYGRTMLNAYLVKIGLQYQKADNRKSLCPRLAAWRCKYLIKVQKYSENGYLIVYQDKTGFVSHDTVRMLWSDGTKSCSLLGPMPKGKQVAICHSRKSKSFLENSFLPCGK